MKAGRRLAIVVILCAAFVVGSLLYPRHEKNLETAVTKPSKTTTSFPAACVQLLLDKSVFDKGEEIKFTLRNGCDYPIALRNSAPWIIRDKLGKVIYAPIALQVIVEIDPGESKTWVWNQKDSQGNQVEPGTYSVALETMNAGTFTRTFRIR